MNKRRLQTVALAYIFLVMLLFSACGGSAKAKEWTENGLELEAGGQVILCVVDSFEKGFYDIKELTGMAVEEAALFNGKNKTGESTPVSVEEVSQIEGDETLVRVIYRFDSTASYALFQGEQLYYGTLEEAIEDRLVFSGEVLLHDGESVTLDENAVKKIAGHHVIVTDARNVIRTPYEVIYYSEGVKVLKNGSVSTEDCTDMAILVLAK